MKTFIFTFSVLLYSITLLAQENLELKNKILKLDLAHAEAIFKSDAKELDNLISDDITVNHPTNRIVNEKEQLLQLIASGVIKYSSFKRFPEKFLFFNDMVIVMGSEEVVPSKGAPNEGKTLNRRYTNIWMKKNNEWKLSVRHANNVCAIE